MNYKTGKHVPATHYTSIHRSLTSFGIWTLVLALALVMVQTSGGTSYAFSSYLTAFETAFPAAVGSRIDVCILCHNQASGGSRNPYGTDFANASIGNHTFNATLGAANSDGTGGTNNAEIAALTFPGDPNDPQPAQDNTAPTVSSTVPDNNATGVATNAVITATFNEAILVASVNDNTFFVSDGVDNVAGTFTVAGAVVTFDPSAALADNTPYTATLTTGITDLAGNPLGANYTWSFTTGTTVAVAPTVSSTVPDNNATGVATNTVITVTFSEAILAASVNDNTFFVSDGVDNVAGTFTVNGAVVTFDPSAALAENTTYTATLTTGITDLGGTPLGANYTWSFTTGTTVVPPPPAPISLFGRGDGGGGCAVAMPGSGVKGLAGAYGVLLLTVLGLGIRNRRNKRK